MSTLPHILKIYIIYIIYISYTFANNNETFFKPNEKNVIFNKTITIRGQVTTNVTLPCELKDINEIKNVDWWCLYKERKKIGSFKDNRAHTDWTKSNFYKVLFNNNSSVDLLLINVRRELVNRYECIIELNNQKFEILTVFFRLDYSHWFSHRWDSLFYGSCLSSLAFCAASFVLNIIWIVSRKTVLWWISRTERMSRVRSMVEAMEKYRQRQIENLHDTYNRRVTAIRENYNQQVEQLRNSYANQAGRFRGYRQARMENVTQHLDNIKENYNQQLIKIRDYGSRGTEQLLENYERQLNRVRLFTLQQRLRLQRRYKVKQRYINKLLETIADKNSPQSIEKKEDEIRAALHIDDLEFQKPPQILRSASYFSLPEFVIEEELATNSLFDETITTNFLSKVPSTSKNSQTRKTIVQNNTDRNLNTSQPPDQTLAIQLRASSENQTLENVQGSKDETIITCSKDNLK